MQREIRVRKPELNSRGDELPAELHPVLRRVYLNRGVTSADELSFSLAKLHSYHLSLIHI